MAERRDGGDGSTPSPPAAEHQQAGGDPNLFDPRDMAAQYQSKIDGEVRRLVEEEVQRRMKQEVDRRVAAEMAERGRSDNVPASVLERLADSIAAASRREPNGNSPTGVVEMRQQQRLEVPDFNPDGLSDEGEVVAAFQVFQTSIREFCGHHDLWDVLNGIRVPVGNSDIPMELLNSNFRPEVVK